MTATLDRTATTIHSHTTHWHRNGIHVCHAASTGARRFREDWARALERVETARFQACRTRHGLSVLHRFDEDELSNELGELVAAELDVAGLIRGPREFEAVLLGLIHSIPTAAARPWIPFYRNTIAALESGRASFAPVHQRAARLVSGDELLDLGSCFGFFPLRMAATGLSVTAADITSGTVELLGAMATQLERPLHTLHCDAADVPRPDRSFDTVTLLHLLEHLPPQKAWTVIAEALRLARRRVIIAVPFEPRPRACFGHLQAYDVERLHALGARTGLDYNVSEHHGGWLVIDQRG
ncbi:mycofactocin oligosaccharide methyltransferase MftM [Tomitella biformata]|uniref:mycofactocin oligosaccharide methyltransferase MftM n=1 Tax=Tomitella biformata TaxID=630403 RepID=UPI0004669149|nr:mycofactocin oligosaccharide methyltransferase MftM [Tomitella biformata]